MNSFKLMLHRINKDKQQIENNPLENILVTVKQTRQIHFCLYGLSEPYQKGFYHGVLQLSQNYPFSAPKFKFFTKSGRFQPQKYVCTTFTSYHQEEWSSSWTIRTILTAILSFFLISNQSSYGSVQSTKEQKKQLALRSLEKNLTNQQFVQLFSQKLIKIGIVHQKLSIKSQICLNKQQSMPINNENINLSLNESLIQPEKQNKIGSSMIQNSSLSNNIQATILPIVNRQNHQNKYIGLLYVGLITFILVLVLVKN